MDVLVFVGITAAVAVVCSALFYLFWRLVHGSGSHLTETVTIRVDREFVEGLERLKASLGQSERAKTIRLGLILLGMAVEARENGYEMVIIDAEGNVLKEIELPNQRAVSLDEEGE